MAIQREWLEKDFYKTLGVSKSANDKEITKAYRKLAKQYHPDANPGDSAAEAKFKEVSGAYDVLGDAAKRREYDEARRLAASGGFTGMPGSPGMGGFGGRSAGERAYRSTMNDDLGGATGGFSFEDLGDLFGNLFNRESRGDGSTNMRGGSFSRRGPDYEGSLTIGFEDAVKGLTTAVNVNGNMIKVRIPEGVDDGQTIRIKGKGGPGQNGGENGDLFVHLSVAPHEIFARDGRDLKVKLPVTYAELVLGATVKVPTLDGAVTVKIPPGTQPGKTLRVRGKGLFIREKAGDLLVTLELAVPKVPTDTQRKLIEELGALDDGSDVRKHLGVK